MAAVQLLPIELIDLILLYKCIHNSTNNNNPSILSSSLIVCTGLTKVAKYLLQKSNHIWPLQQLFKRNRVDVLDQLTRMQLHLDTCDLLKGLSTASILGHVQVLRWISCNYPLILKIQRPLDVLRLASKNGFVDVLQFWVFESGWMLDHGPDAFGDPNLAIYESVVNGNHTCLAWWIKNRDLFINAYSIRPKHSEIPVAPINWQPEWPLIAIENNYLDLIHMFASAESCKHIIYDASLPHDRNCIVMHNYLDQASIHNHVHLLEKYSEFQSKYNWSEMPIYSSKALDHTRSTNVLDWWFNSNLPLKYTSMALHLATRNGQLDIIKYWFNNQPRLYPQKPKYTQDVMIEACTCASLPDPLSIPRRLKLVKFWSEHFVNPCYPRVIHLCNLPHVLEFWKQTLNDIPEYTCTPIHRACYGANIPVLEWWIRNTTWPLKYTHRAMELAACSPTKTFPTVLEWWIKTLPAQYRGNILEWTALSSASPHNLLQRQQKIQALWMANLLDIVQPNSPDEYTVHESTDDPDIFVTLPLPLN